MEKNGRAGSQRAVRGGGRKDLHDERHLLGALDLALDVLAGVGDDGDELVQHLRVGRRVGGAHDVPDDADLLRRVRDQRRVGEVLHRGRAPLAAAVVERVRAGAVEREVHVAPVAADVERRVAPGEEHVARRRGQRRFDEPRRDAHEAGVRVHRRTGLGQQRLRPGVGEQHADAVQQAQRGLVDGVQLGRRGRRDARDHADVRAPRRAARAAPPCTPSAASRRPLRRSGRGLPCPPPRWRRRRAQCGSTRPWDA